MKNGTQIFLNLSENIQSSIEQKLYEYYDIEKSNSILFVPLYSCIMQSGNHFQPIIPMREKITLNILSDELKACYIYPGYFMDIDYINETNFENMLLIISMYDSLFGNSVNYNSNILLELDKFKKIFSKEIPRDKVNKDIFASFTKLYCTGLNNCLEQIRNILNSSNAPLRPIVILPREDIYKCNYDFEDNGFSKTIQNLETLKAFQEECNARIFLSSNNAGKDISPEGIALRFYENLFENQFPIIKQLDDFASIYSKIIMKEAKNAIDFDKLVLDISTGLYGKTEEEIIKNISKINIHKLQNSTYTKRYNIVY